MNIHRILFRLIMDGLELIPLQYRAPLPTATSSLSHWLESLKLTQYTATFIQRGFTSMSLIANLVGVSNIETVCRNTANIISLFISRIGFAYISTWTPKTIKSVYRFLIRT